MGKRSFVIGAVIVVLAAFVIREWFVLSMWVPNPVRGDAQILLRYARQIGWEGTFGHAGVPDAYRPPLYPWLLSVFMDRDLNRWFGAVYQMQAVFGAATVACTIALARRWMPRGFALLAGVVMALQPHHIAATGVMLTEVTFGLLLVAALLAAAHRFGVLAGLLFGLAYLTNPVVACLPFLIALLWRRRDTAVMALVVLIAIGGWSLRNTVQNVDGGQRAAENLVQGSWPEYHGIFKEAWRWPAKDAAIKREVALAQQDPEAAIGVMFDRMAKEPARYAGWYLSKPYLLFDWEIRMGHGMAYTMTTYNSLLDRMPLLATTTVQWVLNPLLFALAFCGLVLGFVRGGAERMVALAVLYLTAVHVVLQAEPRYAIPYRSLEILLAVGAIAYLRAALETLEVFEPAVGNPARQSPGAGRT